MTKGYPSSPNYVAAAQPMPPVGNMPLGGITDAVDVRANFLQRHRTAARVLAGFAVVSTIGVGAAVMTGNSETDLFKDADAVTLTPELVAASEDCKNPSDSDKYVFQENGKPNFELKIGKQYSIEGIIANTESKICTEVEAAQYMAELHPVRAFGAATFAENTTPDKPLTAQIATNPELHKQVVTNLVDLLKNDDRTVVMLGDEPAIAGDLYTLRQDEETRETHAEAITADEAKNLVVVRFTQNDGDYETDRASITKYLVLGEKGDDGLVVANENTDSIIVTPEGLDGCIVIEPVAATENPEVTLPMTDENQTETGGDQQKKGQKKEGGTSGSDKDKGGKTGPDGSDCEDCEGGKDENPAPSDSCDTCKEEQPTVPPATAPKPTQPQPPVTPAPTQPTQPTQPTIPPTQPTSPPTTGSKAGEVPVPTTPGGGTQPI